GVQTHVLSQSTLDARRGICSQRESTSAATQNRRWVLPRTTATSLGAILCQRRSSRQGSGSQGHYDADRDIHAPSPSSPISLSRTRTSAACTVRCPRGRRMSPNRKPSVVARITLFTGVVATLLSTMLAVILMIAIHRYATSSLTAEVRASAGRVAEK